LGIIQTGTGRDRQHHAVRSHGRPRSRSPRDHARREQPRLSRAKLAVGGFRGRGCGGVPHTNTAGGGKAPEAPTMVRRLVPPGRHGGR